MERRDPRRRPYRPHIRALDAPTDRDLAHIYVAGADLNHPDNELIHAETELGMDYLGVQSYSLLTGYVAFALPQRLKSLIQLGHEADGLAARFGPTPGWDARERLEMIQWVAASQVCMMIEELAALTTAIAAWRSRHVDIATTYLRWQGDITETIRDVAWNRREFWADLVAYPGHAQLPAIGMTAEEVKAFRPLVDGTLELAQLGVEWARTFFTEEMRRVYVRFKHGFSLVSPLTAPVAIDLHLTPKAAMATFGGSLCVLDQTRRRDPVRLLAMRCTAYDFSGIQQAAVMIAGTAGFVAGSLVMEARSLVRRGILLATAELRPLNSAQRRAHEVYVGAERGAGRYRFHEQDHVIRLQRDLEGGAEKYRDIPLPNLG
ncbi:MAG: hypothetical protein WEE67_04505 [Chloroflexota bacterium]